MCQNVDDERPAPGACESQQIETFQPSLLRRGVLSAFALARRVVGSVTTSRLTGIRSWRCSMSEVWSQCEGQVVDNKFRLRQFLGETDDSAVFLTSLPEPSACTTSAAAAWPTATVSTSSWNTPTKTSLRFSPCARSPIPKLAKCSVPCLTLSFFSMAKASFIPASSHPTFSPPPINSSFPATLFSPSVNPESHRAASTLTTLPKLPLARSPLPPTSGL